jgi:hypothetical protein
MSVEKVEEVLKQVKGDVGFAAMVGADPRRLAEYDLEPDELKALLGQDVDALREMGVDPDLAEGARLIGRMTG